MEPVLTTKKRIHPNKNAGKRPKQSRIWTYKPPASGLIALNSPYVRAPNRERTPPRNHTDRASKTEFPTALSTRPGTRKIPDPMTVPTINNTKSRSRKTRRRPGALGLPALAGFCKGEIRLVSLGTELLQTNVVGAAGQVCQSKSNT